MPILDASGFDLHYCFEGDFDKPVLLLSNSLGADHSMWDPQMPALLPHFRVLRYDTRGHGRSGMPDTPTTLAALAGDAAALLAALAVPRAHICGVSLGGLTAMWLGLHAKPLVLSLVLSNTAAKIGNTASWNERIANVQQGGVAAIADTVPLRWFTPAFFADPAAFPAQRAMLLRCSTPGYAAASAAVRDTDLRGDVHAIGAPTLVISGAFDMATPPADGQALAASIPNAIFCEVPGAHLSNIEAPAAYNAVLLPFLLHQEPTQ